VLGLWLDTQQGLSFPGEIQSPPAASHLVQCVYLTCPGVLAHLIPPEPQVGT
jgi:hypothetical protein